MNKKVYFKIKLRIASNKDVICVNEGKIFISNYELQGYATFDYITGIYKHGILNIELWNYDPEFGISFNLYQSKIEDFTLPCKFNLIDVDDKNNTLELEFTERFTEKLNEFEKSFLEAKGRCGL